MQNIPSVRTRKGRASPDALSTDVAVVGAGVTGCFTALALARAGRRVTVLDRKQPSVEASGLNAGTLSVVNKPLGMVRLAAQGVRGWERFERDEGVPTGFRRAGGLRVAETPADVDLLLRASQAHRALGVRVEDLTGVEARARCDALSPGVMAATYSPDDAHNNALVAGRATALAAARAGAVVSARTTVLALSSAPSGWRLETSRGSWHAEHVVVAAGLWAPVLLSHVGVELDLVVRNNQVMVTAPTSRLLDRVVTHVDGTLTLKQTAGGSVLIGGGWPGAGDVTKGSKWPALASMVGNADVAARVVPRLRQLQVVRSWSGFDGRLPDGLPMVGPVPDRPGVWMATSSQGAYTVAPAVGAALAAWVVTGEQPDVLSGLQPGTGARNGPPVMFPAHGGVA